MSRTVSRAENWERVYTSFQNINFAAFDFNSIKQSLIEYHKLYFPETFNDFIESSEQLAIIESFAYVAELIAYRLDMNAHENFISTAQRRDSILRLAKLVSYKADRPQSARGLVKLTSVSTTETIYDANGNNLSGRTVRWNDAGNPNWKDQFILVMNRALERPFGSVRPSERFQLEDVLFEQYSWNMKPMVMGVFAYTANVNGSSVPLELVPVAHEAGLGIVERRPTNNSNFTLLYGSDGLGDASNTTGFFCFTKQGTLQKLTATFDGITPNQTYDININNINNTDVWVNQIDPTTGETLDEKPLIQYKSAGNKSGEWVEVDIAHAQNVIFNTNPARNKYEVETLANNRARLLFGDGEFADIPSGTFNVWARSSLNQDLVVPQSSVVNLPASFTYVDSRGRAQTLSFTFTLISSLQNGSAAESDEHIRITAPSVYYTQDRMVNGADYNIFPLQDSSIVKLRSINRTFAGGSKYIAWHDPSESYENVKLFGTDGVLYYEDAESTIPNINLGNISVDAVITTHIQPLIASTDAFNLISSEGGTISALRTSLTAVEQSNIRAALMNLTNTQTLQLFYRVSTDQWVPVGPSGSSAGLIGPIINITYRPADTDFVFSVGLTPCRLVFHSNTTSFWNHNSGQRVMNFDANRSGFDQVVVLQANVKYPSNTVLDEPLHFDVVGTEHYANGLRTVNGLHVAISDTNNDGMPDMLNIDELLRSPSANSESNYIYFHRPSEESPWIKYDRTDPTVRPAGYSASSALWKRCKGRDSLNFMWLHYTPQYHLVDPAASNIIDMYIITKGYYNQLRRWLVDASSQEPRVPTPLDLRTAYSYLFDNKMLSDTVIAHPGRFKLMFGPRAAPQLQGTIKIIRSDQKTLTDNQVKTTVVSTVRSFFDITRWEFGETFYWSELSAAIHAALPNEISSVVLVPMYNNHQFGDLFQVTCSEDEIFYADVSVHRVEIVDSFNVSNLRLNG